MSELKNKLMEKIENDELKMRPRNFFIFTRIAIEVTLIALVISAIYLINLSVYLPRRGLGAMHGQAFRLELLVDVVPWNYLILGAIGLGISFLLLYRFTGAYKKHFVAVVAIISVLVLIFGTVLAFSNLNERFENRPHFRGLYMMDGTGPGFRNGMGPRPFNLK